MCKVSPTSIPQQTGHGLTLATISFLFFNSFLTENSCSSRDGSCIQEKRRETMRREESKRKKNEGAGDVQQKGKGNKTKYHQRLNILSESVHYYCTLT